MSYVIALLILALIVAVGLALPRRASGPSRWPDLDERDRLRRQEEGRLS